MSMVEQRLSKMGLVLPKPWSLPPGIKVQASLVRVYGKRVLISGHVPIDAEGAPAGPFGRVGAEVTPEEGKSAAQAAMLGIFASLKSSLGDLDRIRAWLRVCGLICASPEFTGFPVLMNGASSVIIDAFGAEIGDHARVAVGVAGLPFHSPLEIEAELELA